MDICDIIWIPNHFFYRVVGKMQGPNSLDVIDIDPLINKVLW
jgi:hypothetical protein